MERKMVPAEILKKPYARLVIPDEDNSYFAEIIEFPGCFATGETAIEALGNVESVAIDWINTALEQGQDIPDPMDANEYSGKLVLRMTKGLHKRSALWAEREGVSLNQFITTCLAEAVGERSRSSHVVVEPQFKAMANLMVQFSLAGNIGGTSMVTVGHNFSVAGTHQQLTTGTGPALIGVPVTSWPKQQERRHG
jgi:predicted RNase H-like HicB family nuclease